MMTQDIDFATEYAVCLFNGSRDTQALTVKDKSGNDIPNPHPRAGAPYRSIDGKQIAAMLAKPEANPKDRALAIIPSRFISCQARNHAAQREHGRFIWSCHDIDSGNYEIEVVLAVYDAVFPGTTKMIYSSASATDSDKRWRVLMPMTEIAGRDYSDVQSSCFDLIEEKGLIVDRALSRCGQPVFLPNVPPERRDEQGDPLFYRHCAIKGTMFNPQTHAGVQARLSQRLADAAAIAREVERMREAAAERAALRTLEYGEQTSPIDAFKAANPLEEIMPAYGYEPAGGPDWISPNSKGRNPSVRIYGDIWCSLSDSDSAIGKPGSVGRWGDAFDLFVHYEHQGDVKKAITAVALKLPSVICTASLNDFDLHPKQAASAIGSKQTFTFVQVGQLTFSKPVYLIESLIETGCMGLIFGDPGNGKSFLAVDMGLSVATGKSFHGHGVKRGPVFYIAGEGHSGLVRRFHAWAKHHGSTLDNALMFKSEGAAQFLDVEMAAAVAHAVADLAALHGPPALIIVDTLARNFGAGDENSTAEMGKFVAAMDRLRGNWPESVLLIVHHSGHSDKGRARGAMALKGALDFEYRIEKDGDTISLSNTKMKDAEPPPQLCFALTTVELEEAASAVLVLSDKPAPQSKTSPQHRIAIASYQTAATKDGIWEDGTFRGVHLDQWREAFYAKHPGDTQEAKKKAFQRVRTELTNSGQFKVHDNVYLTSNPSLIMEIMLHRDSRDKTGHVPPSPGTSGTNALSMSRCPAVPTLAGEERRH